MDELSLKFAEAAAINTIQNCDNLEELKSLSIQLVQANTLYRQTTNQLMQENLKLLCRPVA
jgi:hypothetical protein